jgi:hypothetical protein
MLFSSILRFFLIPIIGFILPHTRKETRGRKTTSLYTLRKRRRTCWFKAEQFEKLTTSPTLVPSSRRAATRRNGKEEGWKDEAVEDQTSKIIMEAESFPS